MMLEVKIVINFGGERYNDRNGACGGCEMIVLFLNLGFGNISVFTV